MGRLSEQVHSAALREIYDCAGGKQRGPGARSRDFSEHFAVRHPFPLQLPERDFGAEQALFETPEVGAGDRPSHECNCEQAGSDAGAPTRLEREHDRGQTPAQEHAADSCMPIVTGE